MANPQIRNAQIYADGLLLGFAKSNTYDISTNRQAQIAAQGYVGHSVGTKLTKLEYDEIIPASGIRSDMIKKFLMEDKSVTIGYFAGGDLYTQDMEVTQATITGEALNGTLTGKFTLEGGIPDIAGPPA
jgi:hypothetical protein